VNSPLTDSGHNATRSPQRAGRTPGNRLRTGSAATPLRPARRSRLRDSFFFVASGADATQHRDDPVRNAITLHRSPQPEAKRANETLGVRCGPAPRDVRREVHPGDERGRGLAQAIHPLSWPPVRTPPSIETRPCGTPGRSIAAPHRRQASERRPWGETRPSAAVRRRSGARSRSRPTVESCSRRRWREGLPRRAPSFNRAVNGA
jgi:hypothetical protein